MHFRKSGPSARADILKSLDYMGAEWFFCELTTRYSYLIGHDLALFVLNSHSEKNGSRIYSQCKETHPKTILSSK